LFPGKAEEEEESELVKGYNEGLKSDVLKVARYGSDKSSSLEFLMKVKPEISIISTTGVKDRDLPSQNILRRLNMINSTTYRTDEEGAVVLTTDGYTLKRE
jgi:competence protein ComEC